MPAAKGFSSITYWNLNHHLPFFKGKLAIKAHKYNIRDIYAFPRRERRLQFLNCIQDIATFSYRFSLELVPSNCDNSAISLVAASCQSHYSGGCGSFSWPWADTGGREDKRGTGTAVCRLSASKRRHEEFLESRTDLVRHSGGGGKNNFP